MKTVLSPFKKAVRLALLLLPVILSSCSIKSDDVRIEDVLDLKFKGTGFSQARIELVLEVANDSRVNITLQEVLLVLSDNKGDIIELTVTEPVTLHKRTTTVVELPATVRAKAGGAGLITAAARLNGDLASMRINGYIRAKAGAAKKTIPIRNMSLDDLLEMVDQDQIKSLNLSF